MEDIIFRFSESISFVFSEQFVSTYGGLLQILFSFVGYSVFVFIWIKISL